MKKLVALVLAILMAAMLLLGTLAVGRHIAPRDIHLNKCYLHLHCVAKVQRLFQNLKKRHVLFCFPHAAGSWTKSPFLS